MYTRAYAHIAAKGVNIQLVSCQADKSYFNKEFILFFFRLWSIIIQTHEHLYLYIFAVDISFLVFFSENKFTSIY